MKARDMDPATLLALADELEKDARFARNLLASAKANGVVFSYEDAATDRLAATLEAHARRFRARADIARKAHARVSS
jgi:hypothetical protein